MRRPKGRFLCDLICSVDEEESVWLILLEKVHTFIDGTALVYLVLEDMDLLRENPDADD